MFGQNEDEGQVYRTTVSYTPTDNGYEVQLPIAYKFINCYGEIIVTITKKIEEATATAYIYEGQRYTPEDIGLPGFTGLDVGYTDVSADLYDQSFRLGRVQMSNLIDYLGGCFGQTYDLLKQLGKDHNAYKDKLQDLRLSNLTIDKCSTRDYKLEAKIKEIAQQRELEDKLQAADQAFSRGDLEVAEEHYKEAQKLDYNNTYIQQQLDKIKQQQKATANRAAYEEQMEKGDAAMSRAQYEEAKAAYQKALTLQPGDAAAQRKLAEIQDLLNKEAAQKKDQKQRAATRQAAKQQAAQQRHSGRIWGTNLHADAAGTGMQESNLIGLFRIDYDIWTIAGEPAHKFRFYWEWDDALNTGYPQYVSVLKDTVVMIAELQQYPDLWDRWNAIKPLYVEIECDILSYKHGEKHVASEGTIAIIPEVIGRSGETVDWSQPSSSNWDELFPYCNYLDHSYFREIGVQEEMEADEEEFGTGITWPKYTFQYSDHINFYQDHTWFDSKYLQLTDEDYNHYSSSVDIVKIVWPVKQIQDIIRDYEKRLKEEKEDNMDKEDFWGTPENQEQADGGEDFWDTPANDLTVREKEEQKLDYQTQQLLDNRPSIVARQREKYNALLNPFTITAPQDGITVDKNVVTIKGTINKYFRSHSNKVILFLNGIEQEVDVNSQGQFANPMVLSAGENSIELRLQGEGFMINEGITIYYDGQATNLRVTLTWNSSGSDIDLHVTDPDGNTCNYGNKQTGALQLDVDDTNGYGPENISLLGGDDGRYQINVVNYSGGEGTEATVYIFVNETLQSVKKHTFHSSKESWEVESVQIDN